MIKDLIKEKEDYMNSNYVSSRLYINWRLCIWKNILC